MPIDHALHGRSRSIERYDVLEHAPRCRAARDRRAGGEGLRHADGHDQPDHRRRAAPGRDLRLRRRRCAAARTPCAPHVLDEDTPIVVADASARPPLHGQPVRHRASSAKVRFYASHKLITLDGVTIGTLCVFDEEPRDLDGTQVDALGHPGRPDRRRARAVVAQSPARGVQRAALDLRRARQPRPEDARWRRCRCRSGCCASSSPTSPRPTPPPAARARHQRVGADGRDDRRGAVLRLARRRPLHRPRSISTRCSTRCSSSSRARCADVPVTRGALPVVRGDRTQLRSLLQNLARQRLEVPQPRPRTVPVDHRRAGRRRPLPPRDRRQRTRRPRGRARAGLRPAGPAGRRRLRLGHRPRHLPPRRPGPRRQHPARGDRGRWHDRLVELPTAR